MDAPNKRLLTDEVRENLSSSDQFSRSSSSGTPEDLVQRLRGAGARVRKSVSEGYKTPPSFTKAQSTGTLIFSSMNDTLLAVYSSANPSTSTTNNNDNSRKRSRSVTDQDERDYIAEDCDMTTEDYEQGTIPLSPVASSRPMKPLRASRRSLFEIRSLPSGTFAFGVNASQNTAFESSPRTNDEEDWSQENPLQSSEQPFEPMVL